VQSRIRRDAFVGPLRPLNAVLIVALLLASAGASGADARVQSLSRALRTAPSYKVRIQAALVLGKLGKREGVPVLVEALQDKNNTVRGVAAQSLGKLGAPEAIGRLKRALRNERDAFAKAQIQKALATLRKRPGRPGKGLYLQLGPFSSRSSQASPEEIERLREALKSKLTTLSAATFRLTPKEEASFEKTGRLGFVVDGNVARLSAERVGGQVEIGCDVQVQVYKWPKRSLISWTSAGAVVQTGSRPKEKLAARQDCLEAAAGQLGEDLKRFFQSQGG